ncbi:LysE family transporter, partial [Klebsiella pneumoniae]|uniref:LysE family transporter n=1 Tax=Klebsiella pneumoniae TaxID=573 RepID=UPI001330F33B
MYSKSMGVTVWLEQFGVLNIWTYLAGMFFIIIVPGPNSLYVLKTSASRGVGAGYRAALGVFIGDAILIFLAFIGVASVIKASPVLFTIVRFLGACY